MRFNLSASAVLALASAVFAQTPGFDAINIPDTNQVIPAGSAFTIQWDAPAQYAAGTVSIDLIGGPTQSTQVVLATIATGVANSAKTYTWTVDASLGAAAVYGLIFRLESNPAIFQYSKPFHIQASHGVPPASTSSVVSVSVSPSSSAAASSSASAITVTTSTGIKTVSLSSQPATTAAVTTTAAPYPVPTVSDVTVILNETTTVPCNISSTAVPTTLSKSTLLSSSHAAAHTTSSASHQRPAPPRSSSAYGPPPAASPAPTTTAVQAVPSAPAPAPSAAPSNATGPVPIPNNAAAGVGGSSLALVAGLIMAFLAL